ncbi:MAG: aldo/keto reductase [Bacillota bacterium]|nr:aldo/keto reductase [Bacillota bacterium]
MEDAYHEGKVRTIGLSNFNCEQVLEIMYSSSVIPAVDQIKIHLRWQQQGIHKFLNEHGITA